MSRRQYAPSLGQAPESTKLVKHKLDQVDEGNEEYDASTFGGFSDYMRRKKVKLQNQDALIRARAPADTPPIFSGMTIHINGYTKPGRIDLWNMIVRYGGVYKQYLEGKTDVTHIIASNLTKTKRQEFAKYRVVKPDWIIDSIAAGRALPWTDIKYRVIDAGHDQHTLHLGKSSAFVLGAEKVHSSYKSGEQKDLATPEEPHASHVPENPSGALHDTTGEASSVVPQNIESRHGIATESASLPDFKRSLDAQNERLQSVKESEVDSRAGISKRPATKTAKDPDFIQDYFRNSRLHHLSTWKANLRLKIDNLAKATAARSGRSGPVEQKVVMHVDFDCFFAAVSSKDRPELVGQPCAVTHGGSNSGEIASCNYKAREYGVKNGMWMKEAVKLCPEIISLPYDFEAYEAASDVFYKVLLALDASALEAVSIDEALVNITNLLPSEGTEDEQETFALELAGKVRQEIQGRTGVEVSIGIGANILQAKLAIKKAKPAGQFYVRQDAVLDLLDTFNVASLPGVGWSTVTKLEDNFNISTISELRLISQTRLQEVFGPKTGISLAQASRGQDKTVVGDIAMRKLVSIEINWGIRLDTPEEVSDYMFRVASELCRKLRDVGFVSAQHLLVKVMRRSKTAPIDPPKFLGHGPCDKYNAGREIPETGEASIVWKYSLALLEGLHIPPNELRGIGVALTKLQAIVDVPDIGQTSVTNYFKSTLPTLKPKDPGHAEKEGMSKEFDKPREVQFAVPLLPKQKIARDSTTLSKVVDEVKYSSDSLPASTQYIVPSQIDPAVLSELPATIREKLLTAKCVVHKKNDIVDDIYQVPRASQIDPQDLAALPASLRHEIIMNSRTSGSNSPRKQKNSTLNQFVVKTPSPKKKRPLILQTLTQGQFVSRPTRKNLTTTFQDIQQQLSVSSSPSAELDREVLANLPEDLKKEVMLQDRYRKLLQKRKEVRQTVVAPSEARSAAQSDRSRRMLDLPESSNASQYGDLGGESIEALRIHISSWYRDEREQGPDNADVADFMGYLRLLIQDEQDLERVESLLRWFWLVVTRRAESFAWIHMVSDLILRTNELLEHQGFGRLQIDINL